MYPRMGWMLVAMLIVADVAAAQTTQEWQKSDRGVASGIPAGATNSRDVVLPSNDGQVWRQYDIRRYTASISGNAKPQQAIVDWILRETGRDVWFSEPFGFLSANRSTVRVYHTPAMQKTVSGVIERFLHSKAERYVMGLRLITVGNPNWRARATGYLRPVNVRSLGVEGWLIPKENAALLLATLRNRSDFREHNAPEIVVHNGQTAFVSRTRPRTFARRLRRRDGAFPFYETEAARIQEGYSLQISPLVDTDETAVDAVLKCDVDQVERFVPVNMDVPAAGGSRRLQLQVPQLVSWRLHERFRWPADQVLLLSCGVVATPGPSKNSLTSLPFLGGTPGRADALLFVEFKGKASNAVVPNRSQTQLPAVRRRF